MGEDFIRCYIGDISLITLQNVQRESRKFDDWELSDGSKFEHKKSYGYKQILIQDELLIEALAKRSVIAENRQPANGKSSLLWNNALLLADVLTLLSLARARYYSTLAVEKNLGDNYSISWGVMTPEVASIRDIVPITNLGRFISEALTFIEQNPNWLEDTGFIPSIYWYAQAQQTFGTGPSILEVALYWISIEIVAGVYIDGHGLGITNKKERVKRFIRDKGYTGSSWNSLDEVIDNWYEVRCSAFHEGKEPKLSRGVLSARLQKARDFASLVLVEMLQPQCDATRLQIARRIQSY